MSFPIFHAIKHKIKGDEPVEHHDESVNTGGRDSVDSACEEDCEEAKKETAICILMEAARHRMMTKKLIGTISITQLVGISTFGVTNEIEASEYDSVLEHEYDIQNLEKEHSLVGQAKDALNSIENIIQSLLNRSKSWELCPYKNTTSISKDVSVGFYLPVFMTVGFSITIEISCTVNSLVSYNRHHKHNHELNKRLKTIEDGNALVGELVLQGISINMAKKAVVATDGTSLEDALKYASLLSKKETSKKSTEVTKSSNINE